MFELRDQRHERYGYLTSCGFQAAPQSPTPVVSFDRTGNRLESPTYRYLFNPDNYMQFDSISFHGPGGAWEQIAADSRLLIRADVRNFFTMNFDSRQIESNLEATRLGPVGNLARVSFFLRILFFKIRMSLATDVAFFRDSGHIPMQVNIPVNAYEYLHPASGILYSWILSPTAQRGAQHIDMPKLDVDEINKGFKSLANAGRRWCVQELCRYKFGVDIGEKRLSMELNVERRLIDRGFFPQFVDDVERYKDAMGWDIDIPKGQHRVGMYFEVSGLPEGGHPWDFWLRLGGPNDDGPATCPAPVIVTPLQT